MKELEQKLIMILYECNQHVTMILHAYQRLKEKLPLTTDTYTKLSLDENVLAIICVQVLKITGYRRKAFCTMMYLLRCFFKKTSDRFVIG